MHLSCKSMFITGSDHKNPLSKALKKIERFKSEGFTPSGRKDCKPIEILIPFDWSYGPEKDPNWRMQCHAWRMLDPYFIAYEYTLQPKYIKTALMYIQDWFEWLSFRKNNVGRAWYDMSVALRGCKLALLHQWTSTNRLLHKNSEFISILVSIHCNELLKDDVFNAGNHGILQAHSLRAIAQCRCVNRNVRDIALRVSDYRLVQLLSSQFDDECIHTEGAFEYHRFAIDKFTEIASSSIWQNSNAIKDINRILDKAKEAYRWMLLPNNEEVPYGDTTGAVFEQSLGDCSTEIKNKQVELKSYGCGYNIIKTHNSYLLLSSLFGKRIHSHDDITSICWWDKGKWLLIDSGKYAYVKNDIRNHVISMKAHNVARILTIRSDCYPDHITSGLKRLDDNTIKGSVELRYVVGKNIFTQRRVILYRPNDFLIVIDSASGERKIDLGLFWNINPDCMPYGSLVDGERKGQQGFYGTYEIFHGVGSGKKVYLPEDITTTRNISSDYGRYGATRRIAGVNLTITGKDIMCVSAFTPSGHSTIQNISKSTYQLESADKSLCYAFQALPVKTI